MKICGFRSVLIPVLIFNGLRTDSACSGSEPVRAELLADVKAICPGQSFHLGVRLKIRPEWHIYWMNAGDAGLPTEVRFTAPKDFKVGPLQYPLPIRFLQPGDIMSYGYSDEVLLIAQVQPPRDLAMGSKASLTAVVSWLVCKKQCIAGSATMEISLAMTEKTDLDNTKLFQHWAEQLPLDPNSAQYPQVDVAGTLSDGEERGAFHVELKWKQSPKTVACYPTAVEGWSVEKVHLLRKKRQTQITVTARRLQGYPLKAKHLKLLVVATQVDGQRIGVWVEVPLGKH